MCGIAAYLGQAPVLQTLSSLLEYLTYRGYDSAGIAVVDGAAITTWRTEGAVSDLRAKLPEGKPTYTGGIAHTRWATHGAPSEANAHPLSACTPTLAIAHNGIIDNYLLLREELSALGHTFRSQTDSEVIAHLCEQRISEGLSDEQAVLSAAQDLRGRFAFVVLFSTPVAHLMAVRCGSPLLVGCGPSGTTVASDMVALRYMATEMVSLADYQAAMVEVNKVSVYDIASRDLVLTTSTPLTPQGEDPLYLGNYQHYMRKEIDEQPRAIEQTLSSFWGQSGSWGEELKPILHSLLTADRFQISGCGSSLYAGLIGRYFLEEATLVTTDVEVASELAYGPRPVTARCPTLMISQSGETGDVLAALARLRSRGRRSPVLAITNGRDSELARQADCSLLTQAGSEVAVASTKTFTTQLAVLASLAIDIGMRRHTLSKQRARRILKALQRLPDLVCGVLSQEESIRQVALRLAGVEGAFVLGRLADYGVALEAALKLREIAYLNAHGIAGGELKHGNLAMLTPQVPALCLVLQDSVRERMLGNIDEVLARQVPVMVVAYQDDDVAASKGELAIRVPRTVPELAPVLGIVALHLLTYHVALLRGCPIDRPRNLAKTSTVE